MAIRMRDALYVHIRVLNVCELGLSGFLMRGKVLRVRCGTWFCALKLRAFLVSRRVQEHVLRHEPF